MDMPPQQPRADRLALRASDADRERVAAVLREHYTEGRLTDEEFQERLERAYVARTFGDLDQLTWDLPAESAHAVPPPPRISSIPAGYRNQIVAFVVVNLFLICIWAITTVHSSSHYFWPIWIILFWGMGLAFRVFGAPQRRARDRARRRGRDRRRDL